MFVKDNSGDRELLVRLAKDDIAAFDTLFLKYQHAIYQNAFKITRNSLIAEDIVQEVFISLWQKRYELDIEKSIGGWLFVSSFNRSLNELKKKLRESAGIKGMQLSEADDTFADDLHGIKLAIIEKAILQLSPQKQKVFKLCKLEGFTYEQAAKQLGISKHTVKEYIGDSIAIIKQYASKFPDAETGLLIFLFCSYLRTLHD